MKSLHEIAQRIVALRQSTKKLKPANIAYLQNIVAAELYFYELLRAIMPLTRWWCSPGIQEQLGSEQRLDAQKLTWLIKTLMKQIASPSQDALPEISHPRITALERYVVLAGILLWARKQKSTGREKAQTASLANICKKITANAGKIVAELRDLLAAVKKDWQGQEPKPLVFQVSLNRPAAPAVERSVLAVKGDAARSLFEVSCASVAWAVLDSGIQADHPAFAEKRVRASLDFTRVRDIISVDTDARSRRDELLQGIQVRPSDAKKYLAELQRQAKEGVQLNWDLVEKLITLDQDDPANHPTNHHGTHVAGIIGARGKELGHSDGMCPDIQLYDLRVLGRSMQETEFAVVAALQYIRYLNDRYDYTTIHGANLSLSIPHNVRNYACGSTPICKECERLVGSGVVVVAAAGNRGYQLFETSEGLFESYAAFSITDPGNAEGVITVGATHANWPHTYGVSFFSSRGPTGDGRPKPDLVAPGERIEAPVLDGEWAQQSGTSMAAPHVSGAAAMLLARYPELVGRPHRIKRILCETATDLGRERSFQGHGMLDVLRALQSI